MSVSVNFQGVQYLSSKEAARVFGYTSDYVSRLARQGKVTATRIGHQWFVDPTSLDKFLTDSAKESEARIQKLRVERKLERASFGASDTASVGEVDFVVGSKTRFDARSHMVAGAAVLCGLIVALLPYAFSPKNTAQVASLFQSFSYELKMTAFGVFSSFTFSNGGADAGTSFTVPHTPVQSSVPLSITDGVVVVPERDAVAGIADRLAESFSDPVEVAPDQEHPETGTIKPVFRDGSKGPSYRYVVVPTGAGSRYVMVPTSTPP